MLRTIVNAAPGTLDGLPIGQFSAGALLAVVILMILTDRLVTRRRLLDERADKERALAALDKQVEINTEVLLPLADVMNSVMRALPAPGDST